MKKSLILILLVSFLSFILPAQEQKEENPFNTIFGFPWGTSKDVVKKDFPTKIYKSTSGGLLCENFKLGEINIKKLSLEFDKESKLEKVVMMIDPDVFEPLFEVFKKKYGEPAKVNESEIQNRMGATFNQVVAMWIDEARAIQLNKYAGQIDRGGAVFLPWKPEEVKDQKEKETQKAADFL